MKLIESKLFRAIISFILLALIAFIGFWVILIASFAGEGNFYLPLVSAFLIAMLIWFVIWCIKLWKLRTYLLSLLGIFFICTVIVISKNLYDYYIESILVVDEQSLYLTDYEPFVDSTKAVFLPEESTFKLQDSLPRINGATALYPLYSAFVQATYPKDNYPLYGSIVKGNTTPIAFQELIDGEVDIIFCAAPSKKQVQEAKEQGVEFQLKPIGREAFVFFVNINNPLENITVEQIQQIYSGNITNWEEVGGKNQDIIAYQRPEGSGSQTMLEKIMGDKSLMSPPLNNRVGGMGAIIDRTASYKNFDNAIGYSFLYFVTGMVKNDQVKLLKINGVNPEKATIESNTYPFCGDFYAITTNKLTNPYVDEFIEWILSPQGQYLVEKTGYVPLTNPNNDPHELQ